MKKWNFIRGVGLIVAMLLIAFGGLENLGRSMKLLWNRIMGEE